MKFEQAEEIADFQNIHRVVNGEIVVQINLHPRSFWVLHNEEHVTQSPFEDTGAMEVFLFNNYPSYNPTHWFVYQPKDERRVIGHAPKKGEEVVEIPGYISQRSVNLLRGLYDYPLQDPHIIRLLDYAEYDATSYYGEKITNELLQEAQLTYIRLTGVFEMDANKLLTKITGDTRPGAQDIDLVSRVMIGLINGGLRVDAAMEKAYEAAVVLSDRGDPRVALSRALELFEGAVSLAGKAIEPGSKHLL